MGGDDKFFEHEEQETLPQTEVSDTHLSLEHKGTHWLRDNAGITLWIIIGFAIIGVITVYRKKIKGWLS